MKKNQIYLLLILVIAGFLRFYNLLFDSPYFFNPDERNMANSITQMRLPSQLTDIPRCILSQFSILNSQFSIQECNLHPHFFAYGQFPLYLAFFSDQAAQRFLSFFPYQPITHHPSPISSFSSAIFWLRFYSALSSVGTVLLIYLISNELFRINKYQFEIGNWKLEIGHYAAVFAAFTPGLIQAAHFGTTESLLTFFFMASVYLSLTLFAQGRTLQNKQIRVRPFRLMLLAIILGLSIGTKLTGIFFMVPPLLGLVAQFMKRRSKVSLFQCFIVSLFFIAITAFFAIAASPFNVIDFNGFKGSVFGYEKDVATGTYEAFYTRQFVKTIPILFQVEKIFPYTLGWPIFILGTIGFLFIVMEIIMTSFFSILRTIRKSKFIKRIVVILRSKTTKDPVGITAAGRDSSLSLRMTYSLILIFSFLVYFLPNAFLFAKWTRFMTPIFPFFAIFAAFILHQTYNFFLNIQKTMQKSKVKNQNYNAKIKIFNFNLSFYILNFAFCIYMILPGITFMSVYTHDDTRVQASRWIYQNIPENSYILFDTGNVIDIPLGLPNNEAMKHWNNTLISFDFYHLDQNPKLFEELIVHLEKADYILIPSRRIFANYRRFPDKYPKTTRYYESLFSGELGFEKVAQFAALPDEQSEETFTVFDHPDIRIYKKIQIKNRGEYASLLKNE